MSSATASPTSSGPDDEQPRRDDAPSAALPPPARARRPFTRGLGVLSGVATFGFVGLVDGVVALVKAPAGAVAPRLWPLVVAHCVAVLLTLGVFLGAAEEVLLESARRVPLLQRFGAWATDGPRRWFARDVDAALGTLLAIVGVAVAVGPVFPAAYYTGVTFHNKILAATAVLLVLIASLGLAGLLATALAAPLRWLLARLGPLASPGVVATLALLATGAQTARFIALHWQTFHNLDGGAAVIALALVVGNAAALVVLGRRARRRRVASRRRMVAAAAAFAVLAFVVSALTFGAKQTVAATVFNRSEVTQYVARGLQTSIDLDRDGYSALFGGGDCNDRDRGINPGAFDVPGNGIDENCSGRDARVELEESDGRMAQLPAELAQGGPVSVVFLSIDAMRPDHMSCYGYRRPTTPNIDEFARRGARFTRAYTASPRSLRSFAGVFTGRYASLVSWGSDVQYPPLSEDNHTLAEQLRDAGYSTAAFNNANYFSRTVGFYQGFEQYVEGDGFKGRLEPVARALESHLRARASDPRPFFVWAHLMEPHDPYTDRTEPRDFGHSQMDMYDEEIAHADAGIAPVLRAIEDLMKVRPVVTVIFGDHGEAFGEHGVYHHSFDLHEEAVRVPLIVRGPGIAPGVRNALASLLDLNPTVLNLANRPVPTPVSGRSLVPVLAGPPGGPVVSPQWRDHLYAEVTPDGFYPSEQKSLIAPPHKIIYDLRRGTWELFDIERDPRETHNLYDENPEVAVAMRERLLSWTDGAALASNRTTQLIAAARLPAVPPMQHRVNVRFGDIMELLGYDLPADTIPIGGVFRATFYYRVLRRTRVPCWMSVQFEPVDGIPIWHLFQGRHFPLYGRYPTTQWNAGEILRDEVTLRVEPEVRPTRLRMVFALEIDPHLQRVPPAARAQPNGALPLQDITIVPPR